MPPIAGASCPKRVVTDKMKEMNVQLDNLCQVRELVIVLVGFSGPSSILRGNDTRLL